MRCEISEVFECLNSYAAGRRRADDLQLDEQFTLPVTVDPYAVTARLERDGVLVIEAPVIVL